MTDLTPSGRAPLELAPGTVVGGRYRVSRLVARGGAAAVFAAEHLVTRRRVALKVPRRDVAGNSLARFAREVDVLGAVQDAGVVQLLDAGEHESLPYLVLELLEGRSLSSLLAARGRLAPAQVVEVGLALARTLRRCHVRGVLHRDVKPANVYVTVDGCVKLLDFGIAGRIGMTESPEQKLTHDGALLGTLEYMAPEALLTPTDIDERVDVYSLGALLHECLTGSVPLEGTFGTILVQLAEPYRSKLAQLVPEAPPALREAIDACLARDRDARLGSLSDLVELLEGVPVEHRVQPLLFGLPPATGATSPPKLTLADTPSARFRGAAEAVVVSTPALSPLPVKAAAEDPARRRRHARAPYLTPARVLRADGSVSDGRIDEISEGGALFVAPVNLPEGERVRLRFALPTTGRVAETSAVVKWNRSSRGAHAHGMELTDPSAEVVESVRAYVGIVGVTAQ